MPSDLAENLRLLCSYYKSIAEVCRRLDVNRPQFNRYLSGQYKPSSHHMRRICDFFGVEAHEIVMPHSLFAQLISVRPTHPEPTPREPYAEHLARLQRVGGASFEPYLGYYFETYYSMAYPGRILRTLVHLWSHAGGGVYYQRLERVTSPLPQERAFHSKYLGMAFLLTDRIFLVDYESLTGNEVTQTILYPSFKNRVTRLSGLRTGVSASGLRIPSSTRVAYDYLGRKVSVKNAWRRCGLYPSDSEAIDSDLKSLIRNDVSHADWHFAAQPR